MDFCLRRVFAACLALAMPSLAASAEASTIRVTTTAQQGGPDACTISDAIQTANTGVPVAGCTLESGGDGLVIQIPAGTYVLTTGTAPDPNDGFTAFPFITVPITIEGDVLPDGSRPIITRDANAPPFRLFRSATGFQIRHLTLSGGDSGWVCCDTVRRRGGAIYVDAPGVTVTIDDVLFENNIAGQGGAIADAGNIYSSVAFTITGSTFRNNRSTWGGAIRVTSGFLSIRNSHFEDNVSEAGGQGGGAIYATSMEATDTTFLHNQALSQYGGAIDGVEMTLTRVTMRGNTAQNVGGATFSYGGRPIVIDSTFDNNRAQRGGAMFNLGPADIRGSTFVNNVATQSGGAVEFGGETGSSLVSNSTFSGNEGGFDRGGAVYLFGGRLSINNVTITGNTSGYGPGLSLGWWGGSHVVIANSIVAGNLRTDGIAIDVQVGGDDLQSLGYNIIGTDLGTGGRFTAVGDQVGTELVPLPAGLLPLADNGGPTQTRALAPGSPALDAGSPAAPGSEGACDTTDQRGVHRPGAGTSACDIGAFEHAITFPLTVHVGSGGSVFGLDGATACVDDECVGTFDSGTIVKLEARPAAGHTFVGWLGGGCESASEICFVTMDAAQTVTATFHSESATTTTTLTSSANPAVNGQDVTFTAVVTADDPVNGTPAGSVTFVSVTESTVIGTAPLIAGTATLTRTPRSSAYVINEIKAIYTGDGTFTPSSDTISQVVNPASTTIELTSSPAPSVIGQQVTFRAVVSAVAPGSGTPEGTVSFKDTRTGLILDTVTLDASGAATVSTSTLAVGLQRIEASYAGPAGDPAPDFEPSVDAMIQTVQKAWTETDLTSNSDSPLSDEVITFNAKVTVTAPGAGLPIGTVTFINVTTGDTLGTAAIGLLGSAVLKRALPAGTHTISANYAGNDDFTSSSGNLSQVTLPSTVTLDINEVVIVSDTIGLLRSQMLSIQENVIVSDTVTPLKSAMLSVNETIIVADSLDLAPESNTPPGNNVLVATAGVPVAMTFVQIVEPGFTSIVASTGPPPPAGFRLTSPPTSFELTTSAVYTGAITVCIGYPANSKSPRLMHFEGGAWVDRTTSVNIVTRTVCGSVTSLSPFAVFELDGVEGRMTGDGAIADGHEFEFRVAERSIGDERGALRYTHKVAKSGKEKARTDRFRATSIGSIVFLDDPAYRPSRRPNPLVDSVQFIGMGTWNGVPGYSFEAEAVDAGEPGRGRDTFAIVIRDPQGIVVASGDGVLTAGNIQSQRVRNR